MQNIIFYSLAIGLLLLSFIKDKGKTKQSLMKAWKSFENMLPPMLALIVLIGMIVSVLSPQTISQIIGGSSGWLGVILGAILGSVTLIPAFIAFPLAAILLDNGAGYMQLSAFISTLTMVGLITLPLEIKYFSKKFALYRNGLALIFAFISAFIIGRIFT